jgi:hypothetical protein
MQKKTTQKLAFTKETLRQLSQQDLAGVAGGATDHPGSCSGCNDGCLTWSKPGPGGFCPKPKMEMA